MRSAVPDDPHALLGGMQSDCIRLDSMDDAAEYKTVLEAFDVSWQRTFPTPPHAQSTHPRKRGKH